MAPSRQTSGQQLEHMISFIEKNITAFGPGHPYTAHTKNTAWNLLTNQLNSMEGIKKSSKNWRNYWNLLKHRTKAKIMEYQSFKRSPKNFAKKLQPLHSLQKRIWRILMKFKNKEVKFTAPADNEAAVESLMLMQETDDVINQSDGEKEDSQPETTFEYYNLDNGDTQMIDHSQSIQANETEETPDVNDSTYDRPRLKVEIEEEIEEDIEENVETKQMFYNKSRPHRKSKEKPTDYEEDNENSDPENEIEKLQKELLKKQILVEEHRLFQIKLQNELLKKQLQEETEKNTHNQMKRLIEKEELRRNHLNINLE